MEENSVMVEEQPTEFVEDSNICEKVTYKQIEEANKEIVTIKIGKGNYATVNERVNAYRKVYPTGTIETDIEEITDTMVRMKTIVTDEDGKVIATGRASETKKGGVNSTSMIENCETSAVGRALGLAGFGIKSSIASGEDIERNKDNIKQFEIYERMFISESDAISLVKLSINELIRKFGIRKVELEQKIKEHLWTDLASLNLNQFLKLEEKLKTINMEENDWNDLYGQNDKIKELTPKGQEVVYKGSWMRFGEIALQMAGDNDNLKDEIIDSYMNQGLILNRGE